MDTKADLLDSAESLMRTCGYDAVSYADLSARVGIRKASIHHHFPRKVDLALAVLTRYTDRIYRELDRIDARGLTAAGKLTAFVMLYREAAQSGQALCLCAAMSSARDSFEAHALGQLDEFHTRCISWLAQVFAGAQDDGSVHNVTDPNAEAAMVLAMVQGAQLLARSGEDISRFDDATSAFLNRMATQGDDLS